MCGITLTYPHSVKIRKSRRCSGCCCYFPVGTIMDHNAMAEAGDIIHSYYCPICVLFWSSEDRYDDCIIEGDLDTWFPKNTEDIFLNNQEGLCNNLKIHHTEGMKRT